MCGVIGFASPIEPVPQDRERLGALFAQSKVRGLHAFGVAGWHEPTTSLLVYKEHQFSDLWRQLQGQRPFPRLLIGHNRYSTSGDWRTHINNQPLVSETGMALVFNGVIDMRPKSAWEAQYKCHFTTDNDGEILLRWMERNGDPVEFLRYNDCSFAGLWLHQGVLYALRNANRPLWYWRSPSGVTFWASTRDIFVRALGEVNPEPVPPLQVQQVELPILVS